MKRFFFSPIVFLLIIQLNAQSFNYEDVKVRYVLPSATPFTTDFKTVTVRFHGDEHLRRYGILPSELAAAEFKFVKFKNVPSQGDLHLDVFIQQPEYLGVVREKGSKKVNDVDVPTYYYKGTVITPHVLRIA